MDKNAVKQAFVNTLTRKGQLNALTGGQIVRGIPGEDALLSQWETTAKGFIHRGQRVEVSMRVERMSYGESWCTPIIYPV